MGKLFPITARVLLPVGSTGGPVKVEYAGVYRDAARLAGGRYDGWAVLVEGEGQWAEYREAEDSTEPLKIYGPEVGDRVTSLVTVTVTPKGPGVRGVPIISRGHPRDTGESGWDLSAIGEGPGPTLVTEAQALNLADLIETGLPLKADLDAGLAQVQAASTAVTAEVVASQQSRAATAAAFSYAGDAYTVVAQYEGTAEAFGGGPFSGFGWGIPQPAGPISRIALQIRDTDAAHRCTTLRWRLREGSHQGAVLRLGTVNVSLSLTEYREVLLPLDSPLAPTGTLYIEVAATGGRLSLRRRPDGQALPNMPQAYTITDGNPDTNPSGGDLWGSLPNPYTMATRLDLAGDGTLVRLSPAGAAAVQAAVAPALSTATLNLSQLLTRNDATLDYAGPAETVVMTTGGSTAGYEAGTYTGFSWEAPHAGGLINRLILSAKAFNAAHPVKTLYWVLYANNYAGGVIASGSLPAQLDALRYRPVRLDFPTLDPRGYPTLWLRVWTDGGYLVLERTDAPLFTGLPTQYILDGHDGSGDQTNPYWNALNAQTTFRVDAVLADASGTQVDFSTAAQAAIKLAAAPLPELAIPTTLYALTGAELNIYWETAYLWPTTASDYAVSVSGYGTDRGDRWTVTPAASDVGEQTLTVRVYDRQKNLQRTDTFTVRVAAANAGSGTVDAVLIGDSNTKRGWLAGAVQGLADSSGGLTLVQHGTMPTEVINPQLQTEGHPGWTVQAYWVRDHTVGQDGQSNPFWNPGSGLTDSKFDFSYYQQQRGLNLQGKDLVGIILGTNSMDDPLYYNLVEREMAQLRIMVQRIHAATAAHLFVATQIPFARYPPAGYKEGLPQVYSRAMLSALSGLSYVTVLPFGAALSRDLGFRYTQRAVSAYAPGVTEHWPFDDDYVHFGEVGGKQLAVPIVAFMKWWASH